MQAHRILLLALLFIRIATGDALAQSTPSPALLIGEKSGAQLAIVDPSTLELVAQVPANDNPHEVATDGEFAYVSNAGAGAITVIDLEAQEQVEGIDLRPLGAIHGLWMADGKLYFANESTRTLSRYDPAAQEIDWVLGTGLPRSHMLVVSEDASAIFTSCMTSGTASIIERHGDSAEDWEITTMETGPRAEGLTLSPDGQELWVANVQNSTISIIDVQAKQVAETIELPTAFSNRLTFTLDGRYVLVADLQGDEIVVLDASTREETARIDVGGGTEGLLVTPDGARAFAAVSPMNKVVEIDLETLTVTGEVTGLDNPDGMAWVETP